MSGRVDFVGFEQTDEAEYGLTIDGPLGLVCLYFSQAQAEELWRVVDGVIGERYRQGLRLAREYVPPADEEGAYELSDPKHPTYTDRLAAVADRIRKERRER